MYLLGLNINWCTEHSGTRLNKLITRDNAIAEYNSGRLLTDNILQQLVRVFATADRRQQSLQMHNKLWRFPNLCKLCRFMSTRNTLKNATACKQGAARQL